MAHGYHADLTGEDIHVPYAWSYADTAAREGATGFVAGDVGKLALQEDDNSLWILTATTPTWVSVAGAGGEARKGIIGFTIDGGGGEITDGLKGTVPVPGACTIKAVRMYADQSGSIVVDIWAADYANYPPTDADSLTAAGTPPTITMATKSEDATLTNWVVSLAEGDVLAFNVDSCTTITRCVVALFVEYN